MAVAYTVYGADGAVVSQQIRPLDSTRIELAMADVKGDLRVDAQLVNAEGKALTAPQSAAISLSSATQPAAKAAEAAASNVELNTSQIVNVREGPGTGFSVLGQIMPGESYKVTGKTQAGDWWQVNFEDRNGWVIGQLVSTAGDSNAVAVVTDLPQSPQVSAAAPAPEAAAAAPAEAPADAGGGE